MPKLISMCVNCGAVYPWECAGKHCSCEKKGIIIQETVFTLYEELNGEPLPERKETDCV